MTSLQRSRTAYVAFGLQSGGSTIVSYCFLQRGDLAGPLDWFHDRLPEPEVPATDGRQWWCKVTVASFRAVEVIEHLRDQALDVRPLLVVRDMRPAFDSLLGKPYGRNGTTAEDPPLRLRMRRFHADWQWFVNNGLPILRYERFVAAPEETLRAACSELGLSWDPAMIRWPRPPRAVWNRMGASRSFIRSISGDLASTLRPDSPSRPLKRIGRDDLAWLEDNFSDYNRANGYPERLSETLTATLSDGRDEPQFAASGRYPRARRNRAIRRLLGPLAGILAGQARFL